MIDSKKNQISVSSNEETKILIPNSQNDIVILCEKDFLIKKIQINPDMKELANSFHEFEGAKTEVISGETSILILGNGSGVFKLNYEKMEDPVQVVESKLSWASVHKSFIGENHILIGREGQIMLLADSKLHSLGSVSGFSETSNNLLNTNILRQIKVNETLEVFEFVGITESGQSVIFRIELIKESEEKFKLGNQTGLIGLLKYQSTDYDPSQKELIKFQIRDVYSDGERLITIFTNSKITVNCLETTLKQFEDQKEDKETQFKSISNAPKLELKDLTYNFEIDIHQEFEKTFPAVHFDIDGIFDMTESHVLITSSKGHVVLFDKKELTIHSCLHNLMKSPIADVKPIGSSVVILDRNGDLVKIPLSSEIINNTVTQVKESNAPEKIVEEEASSNIKPQLVENFQEEKNQTTHNSENVTNKLSTQIENNSKKDLTQAETNYVESQLTNELQVSNLVSNKQDEETVAKIKKSKRRKMMMSDDENENLTKNNNHNSESQNLKEEKEKSEDEDFDIALKEDEKVEKPISENAKTDQINEHDGKTELQKKIAQSKKKSELNSKKKKKENLTTSKLEEFQKKRNRRQNNLDLQDDTKNLTSSKINIFKNT